VLSDLMETFFLVRGPAKGRHVMLHDTMRGNGVLTMSSAKVSFRRGFLKAT
jgi:hypothetical protein